MPKKSQKDQQPEHTASEYLKYSHKDFCNEIKSYDAETIVSVINDLYKSQNHELMSEECIQRLDVAIVELEKRCIADYLSDTGNTIAMKANEMEEQLDFELDLTDRCNKRWTKVIQSFLPKKSKK